MKTNKIERSQKKFLEAMKRKFEEPVPKIYLVEYNTVIKNEVRIMADSAEDAKAKLVEYGAFGVKVAKDQIQSIKVLK